MLRIESIEMSKVERQRVDSQIILIMILGFFISRVHILNKITPFGIAFLGAYLLVREPSQWVMISVIGGLFSYHGLNGIDYYIITLLIYGVFTKIKEIKECTIIRVSIILSLIFCICRVFTTVILGEFMIFDFFMIGFESILIFTMTYIFSFSLPLEKIKNNQLMNEKMICSFITMALVLSGLNSISFYGISLKNIVSVIIVIYLSYNQGALMGVGAAVVVGMVSYMAHTEMPFIISLMAVGGLLGGLFRDLGRAGSTLGFILGNGIVSFYINNLGTSFLSYKELFVSSIGFLLISQFVKIDIDEYFIDKSKTKKDYEKRKDEIAAKRLNNMVELFNSLSQIFKRSIEEESKFSPFEVYDLIDEVSNKTCKSCINYDKCWEDDYYTTYHRIFNLIGSIETNGAKDDILTSELKSICVNHNTLVDNSIEIHKVFKDNQKWNLKLMEQRKLLTQQIEELSRVMKDISDELYINPIFNEELEGLLIKELKNNKVDFSDLTVVQIPGRDLEILIDMNLCKNPKEEMERMKEIISESLGYPIKIDFTYGGISHDKSTIKITRSNRFASLTKIAQQPNSEDLVSGDNYTFGEMNNTSFLAISDGMGSGKKANVESSVAIELLEKLMETNMNKNMIIKTINSVLRAKSNDEIFTTLDLGFVDLYTGRLQVVKNGSPATFIKKKDGVKIVNNRSLPIGILEDVDFSIYEEDLEDGDIIIMMSDGALESNMQVENLESWMKDVIAGINSENPEIIANEILNIAKFVSKDNLQDDMTVMATKVWKSI